MTLQSVSWAFVDQNEPDRAYSGAPDPTYPNYYHLDDPWLVLFHFGDFPERLRHSKLYSIQMTAHISKFVRAIPLMGEFTPGVTTWNTKPDTYPSAVSKSLYLYGNGPIQAQNTVIKSLDSFASDVRSHTAALALQFCSFAIENAGSTAAIWDVLIDGTSRPYVTVTYDDTEKITSSIKYKSGPSSGYFNPRNAATFQWQFVANQSEYYCADDSFSQQSATFYWKASDDENYTAVSVSGSTEGLTIPANTFPAATSVQWYVEGTDDDGNTSQTDVFTFSTTAGTATATARSPIDSVEDDSDPITFTWALGSTDGQTPSGVDLWWKTPEESNNQWHSLLANAAPVTSYTAAGGTFPAGEIQWLVRAYNIDGTAGPWSRPSSSSYYSFICVAAPDPVQGLAATEVPLTTISWQSDGQEAYEISVDGEVVRKAWGTDVYSWQVVEPLAEGAHVIAVRVQGVYGLWSQPSTITITVGGPAASFVISGEFGTDAVLSIEGESDGSTVHWYRDGVQVGSSVVPSFVDFRALGTYDYFARIFLADGNYTQSNTVTGSMSAPVKKIRELTDLRSQWLDLKLSENSADEEDFSWQQTQAVQHITGTEFPALEDSDYQDETATYNVAFPTAEEGCRLEALRGKVIILKSRGGNVMIGSLGNLQKRVTAFYVAYTFTIQRIHAEDFVHYE